MCFAGVRACRSRLRCDAHVLVGITILSPPRERLARLRALDRSLDGALQVNVGMTAVALRLLLLLLVPRRQASPSGGTRGCDGFT